MNEITCEHFHELAAELALDILPGDERAVAVAHIERCSECSAHLGSLTAVGDGLLGLVPALEPSSGFETRVLNGLRPAVAARRRRRGRLLATAAAVVLVASAGAGGAAVEMAIRHGSPPAPVASAPPDLRSGTFTADGHDTGQVFVYRGQPPWVYMSIHAVRTVPTAVCQIQRRDGSFETIGQVDLAHGYGHWGGPMRTDPTTVTGARLVAPDGSVIATAKLPA
jgi:hypothetical protein